MGPFRVLGCLEIGAAAALATFLGVYLPSVSPANELEEHLVEQGPVIAVVW